MEDTEVRSLLGKYAVSSELTITEAIQELKKRPVDYKKYLVEYKKAKKAAARSKAISTEGKSRNARIAKHDRVMKVQRLGG